MSLGRRVVSALLFLSVGLPLVQGFVGRLGFPHRAVRSGSRLFAEVSLNEDDYVAVGYAVCFKINSETNKPEEFPIIEPIPSAMLECLDKGVPTSYKRVGGFRLGDVLLGDPEEATGVNMDFLKSHLDKEAEPVEAAENFIERATASARTFRRRVEAQILDLNEVADDFNFSVEKKRLLNTVYEPSFDDNVKQHASIDVYGRDDESGDHENEVERLANV